MDFLKFDFVNTQSIALAALRNKEANKKKHKIYFYSIKALCFKFKMWLRETLMNKVSKQYRAVGNILLGFWYTQKEKEQR